MTDRETEEVSLLTIIPVHFDVPEHHVPLDFFQTTIKDTATVVGSLNDLVFAGRLQYRLVILPPAEGTFISRIGLIAKVGGVILAVPWALENDIAKGFIEGLTGRTTHQWSQQFGSAIQDAIQHSISGDSTAHSLSSSEYEDGALSILKECATSFLKMEQTELRTIGIDASNFYTGFDARNEFYETCLSLQKLKAIGFDTSNSFPIRRSDFQRFIVPRIEREDDLPSAWRTGFEILKVTSPNWVESDKQRLWKARDEAGRDRYFRIEDESFWRLARDHLISPTILDIMKVQWAFREFGKKKKDFRVLKVLEFNGATLSEPLEEDDLQELLGRLEARDQLNQFTLNFNNDSFSLF